MDKTGLEIINQIYKSKGNKNVVYKLPEEKSMYETQISFMSKKDKVES